MQEGQGSPAPGSPVEAQPGPGAAAMQGPAQRRTFPEPPGAVAPERIVVSKCVPLLTSPAAAARDDRPLADKCAVPDAALASELRAPASAAPTPAIAGQDSPGELILHFVRLHTAKIWGRAAAQLAVCWTLRSLQYCPNYRYSCQHTVSLPAVQKHVADIGLAFFLWCVCCSGAAGQILARQCCCGVGGGGRECKSQPEMKQARGRLRSMMRMWLNCGAELICAQIVFCDVSVACTLAQIVEPDDLR